LHKLWEEDLLNERIVAATWLWRRTGEYKLLLALCREGMQSSTTALVALNALGEIAPKVPEAIPLIAAAVKSPNQTVRYRAWQILRKIAPKELPPVS
jgi:HEAT repeat protein